MLRLPLPVGFTPQGLHSRSPRHHELEIFAVGDFVLIDGEGGHFDGVCFVLVVPAEHVRLTARQTERRVARRNLDHARCNRRTTNSGATRLPSTFWSKRQLVQHVRQRFRMHQAVFDGHIQQLARGMPGLVMQRRRSQTLIERLPDLLHVSRTWSSEGQSDGWSDRQTAVDRIDAEGKQVVEF